MTLATAEARTSLRDGLGYVVRRPALAAYMAFLALLPLPRLSLHVGSLVVQVSDVALGLAWLIGLVDWISGKSRMRFDAMALASVAFLMVLALSIALSHDVTARSLIKLVAFAPLVFLPSLTSSILGEPRAVEVSLWGWFLGAGMAVAVGWTAIVAFYASPEAAQSLLCGYGQLHAGGLPRLCAPFLNQNMYCNFLVVAMTLWLGFAGRAFRPLVAWGVFAAAAVVAGLTMSIGLGGLALATAVLLIGRYSPWPIRSSAVRTLLVAGALAAAIVFAVASAVSPARPESTTVVEVAGHRVALFDGPRPSIWRAAWRTIDAHPWLGKGYSATVAHVTDLRSFVQADRIPGWKGARSSDMEGHNSYLNVAGQAGVLGLAAFLIVLVVGLRGLFSVGARPGVLASLPGAIQGAAVGALVYHSFFAALDETRHLWALLGLSYALVQLTRARTADATDVEPAFLPDAQQT